MIRYRELNGTGGSWNAHSFPLLLFRRGIDSHRSLGRNSATARDAARHGPRQIGRSLKFEADVLCAQRHHRPRPAQNLLKNSQKAAVFLEIASILGAMKTFRFQPRRFQSSRSSTFPNGREQRKHSSVVKKISQTHCFALAPDLRHLARPNLRAVG